MRADNLSGIALAGREKLDWKSGVGNENREATQISNYAFNYILQYTRERMPEIYSQLVKHLESSRDGFIYMLMTLVRLQSSIQKSFKPAFPK